MSTDAAIRDERASGLTPAEEATREASKDADTVVEEAVLPEERDRWSKGPGFSRMRMDWSSTEDRSMMAMINAKIDDMVGNAYPDAYGILHELYEVVREQVINQDTDEAETDKHGWPVWKRTATGNFVEDWTKLTTEQAHRFLFQITTRLFGWQQTQADAWAEAMYAKAAWEEAFAHGYESFERLSGNRPTVDDRVNAARRGSSEERYFALFKAHYSRRADSLVRTMELLNQRLKDVYAPSGR